MWCMTGALNIPFWTVHNSWSEWAAQEQLNIQFWGCICHVGDGKVNYISLHNKQILCMFSHNEVCSIKISVCRGHGWTQLMNISMRVPINHPTQERHNELGNIKAGWKTIKQPSIQPTDWISKWLSEHPTNNQSSYLAKIVSCLHVCIPKTLYWCFCCVA